MMPRLLAALAVTVTAAVLDAVSDPSEAFPIAKFVIAVVAVAVALAVAVAVAVCATVALPVAVAAPSSATPIDWITTVTSPSAVAVSDAEADATPMVVKSVPSRSPSPSIVLRSRTNAGDAPSSP
jgi:hypothetical protein